MWYFDSVGAMRKKTNKQTKTLRWVRDRKLHFDTGLDPWHWVEDRDLCVLALTCPTEPLNKSYLNNGFNKSESGFSLL